MNIKIADLEFEPLIPSETIQSRITEITAELNEDFADKTPVFVGVLNGCFMFMADMVRRITVPCEVAFTKLSSYHGGTVVRRITVPCEVAFTKLSSYHGGTTSTRQIQNDLDLLIDITNRHIILIEDIVDTGNTLDYLVEKLKQRKPASITVVALLLKPDAVEYSVEELKYVAFQIPNEFVVGYGLDYMEQGRNLNGIYKRVV